MGNVLSIIAMVLCISVVLSDLYARRVPNAWLLAALLLGIATPLASWLLSTVVTTWPSAPGLVVGLLGMLPFYALRWMGAGDVKFFATLGFLLGARALLPIWVIAGLLTGVHVLGVLLLRIPRLANAPAMLLTRCRLSTSSWWQRMLLARQGRVGQPHAAYLAIAAILTMLYPSLLVWSRP
jgi:prepilin peptidase CpaA